MPRKKEISFWNSAETCIGFIYIFSGLLFLFLITRVIPPSLEESEIMSTGVTIFISCFMVLLFVAGIALLISSEDRKCYYCHNKIYNFHKRIIVEWPEITKYSKKEAWVSERMHLLCHQTAKEKFKIPDSKFTSIGI